MRAPAEPRAQTLHLVAVVVRDEHVGDAVDAELGEVVERGAGAEVDEHGLASRAQDVDVAGVRGSVRSRRRRRPHAESSWPVATIAFPGPGH